MSIPTTITTVVAPLTRLRCDPRIFNDTQAARRSGLRQDYSMKNNTLCHHAGALLVILTLGALSQTLSSQQPAKQMPKAAQKPVPPGYSDETYRVNVDLINVFCSVWDKDTGAFVTNLTRDDFAV